jgi:hypothetical protein
MKVICDYYASGYRQYDPIESIKLTMGFTPRPELSPSNAFPVY